MDGDAQQVAQLTGLSHTQALALLQRHGGDVEAAITAHFDAPDPAATNNTAAAEPGSGGIDGILNAARANTPDGGPGGRSMGDSAPSTPGRQAIVTFWKEGFTVPLNLWLTHSRFDSHTHTLVLTLTPMYSPAISHA